MNNLLKLLKIREEARASHDYMGMINTSGLDYEELIKLSCKYKLALDAYIKADKEYQEAINSLSTDELMSISNGFKE